MLAASQKCPSGRFAFNAIAVRAAYTDFEDLWSPLLTGVAPSGAFCTSLDDDGRAALHNAYRRRLGVGDGLDIDAIEIAGALFEYGAAAVAKKGHGLSGFRVLFGHASNSASICHMIGVFYPTLARCT